MAKTKQKKIVQEHDYSLIVSDVSKHFNIPTEKTDTLIQRLAKPHKWFSNDGKRKLEVLKNVSFKVEKGEFVGILGNNGSGKSTLLKIMSGIYLPNQGKIKVRGILVPFLELGVGFNPELTARDNIYLNGVILGMSRKEVEDKFNSIVAFSELEKFLDMPLKNFSSGMQVRLAFSIAIRSYADIYIMDEVLAVGDANFQKKCFNEFESFRKKDKTVIFVSHDLELVEKFCTRAILINEGQVAIDGTPKEVVKEYRTILNSKQ